MHYGDVGECPDFTAPAGILFSARSPAFDFLDASYRRDFSDADDLAATHVVFCKVSYGPFGGEWHLTGI